MALSPRRYTPTGLSHRNTPKRVPPPRVGRGTHAPAAPSDAPLVVGSHKEPVRKEPLPSTAEMVHLTTDPQILQEQLDQLEHQFDDLRAQLRQSQKLATLGTTAAMVAHEVNNLLTPIVAYAQHALDCNDAELMRTALGKTLDRASAMRNMVDRVVGLARQPDGLVRSVHVRDVVEDAIGCLGRDFSRDNIHVELKIDEDLAVRANENQLLQVLVNLVSNARQAMLGRRGRLTIDAMVAEDDWVAINVRDTGCGIPPEHQQRVFDPFFSTKTKADKPDQRGLGLGLPICRDIIEELGGQISLTSEVGTGTTFTIRLPKAD